MILQQPWARLVAEGVFPVLVRSIPANIRGRVAIISRGVDPDAIVDMARPKLKEFPQHAIIGTVGIVDCIEVPVKAVQPTLRKKFGKDFALFYPKHYFPKRSPAYLWILDNPRLFKRAKAIGEFRSRIWKRL